MDLTRHSLEAAGAEVEIDAPDAPVTTLGHPLRLEQALINLIRNAGQASSEGAAMLVWGDEVKSPTLSALPLLSEYASTLQVSTPENV